jgi:ferredoxin-NADP reductase
MLWDTLERDSHPSLSVLYSARSPEEFAYAGELLALAGDGRLELLRTITRDTTTDWDGTRGRLNSELMGRMLKTPETRCVICGPAALVADASAIAKGFGVSAEHILTETYST